MTKTSKGWRSDFASRPRSFFVWYVLRWPYAVDGAFKSRNWPTSCFSRPEVMLCVDGTLKSRNWLTSCFMTELSWGDAMSWRDVQIQEPTHLPLQSSWGDPMHWRDVQLNPRTDSLPASVVLGWPYALTGRSDPGTDSLPVLSCHHFPSRRGAPTSSLRCWAFDSCNSVKPVQHCGLSFRPLSHNLKKGC